jgi:DNA primase
VKYLIKARLEVDGRVDRHDVIGAIFGQTEGLLGSGFSLEELQEKDKIGRIHVEIKYQGTKTVGQILVPSNLDRVHTSIIAAMLETVDKIGPYPAKIVVEEIKDLRADKIKKIIARARELLEHMKEREPDIKEIVREVLQAEQQAKQLKIVEYGPEKLPAGPGVDQADTIIVVEGRGDVQNLLRYGYSNVIALEGARERVPETIKRLAEKKKIILFVDGDRGGELILKNVLPQMKVDYVARAPEGKEVEELTGKEIARALNQMVPASRVARELGLVEEKPAEAEKPAPPAKPEEAKPQPPSPPQPREEARPAPPPQPPAQPVEAKPEAERREAEEAVSIAVPKQIVDSIKKLSGTLEAVLYDKEWREVDRVKVRELFERLQRAEKGSIYAVVFDGIITQRLLDVAAEKGVSLLIGSRIGSKITYKPGQVKFVTFNDLL